MHPTSLEHMQRILTKLDKPSRILDIGSSNINGSYRTLFDKTVSYIGTDIEKSRGVDVVMPSPYQLPFDDSSFDLIVSGQTFEHTEFFWELFLEMARVTSKHIIIIAPSKGPVHKYPVDCWRFYPDSWKALEKYACSKAHSLKLVDTGCDIDKTESSWGDSWAVYKKG